MNRIKKITEILEKSQAAVIISEPNRFYLTGFASSDGILAISEKSAVFFIDSRYFEKAKQTVKNADVVLLKNAKDQLTEFFKKENIKEIMLENDSVSFSEFNAFKNGYGVKIIEDNILSGFICGLRAVKDESEKEKIIKAQRLTDKTFSYILERIEKGRTEKEIMLDMEFFIRKEGSEGVSFDFVVVSGKNSSLPHGVPTDKKIESGDFITMDFGAVVEGYRSDMTRTVAVGNVNEEQRLVYETVLKAQKAAISAVKQGEGCSYIDKIARDIIDSTRFKGCFGHALGHSVGIEIHESPNFSPRSTACLKAGNVMTVEPGIYIENKFGVRIEDMLFVTETGSINLTASEKELIIL